MFEVVSHIHSTRDRSVLVDFCLHFVSTSHTVVVRSIVVLVGNWPASRETIIAYIGGWPCAISANINGSTFVFKILSSVLFAG